MPNRSYDRGSAFERYVAEKLTAMGFFAMRSAGSHTICDVLSVGVSDTTPTYPIALLIQCKTSKVESIPDLKQLLNGKNVELLKEHPSAYHYFHKIILWKGKGKMNIYAYRHIDGKVWSGHKIKSLEEYIIQII